MINGNSNSYPAKFGKNDVTQIKLFDVCLNGNGDLTSLFFTSSDISSLKNLKDKASNYYNNMSNILDNSNVLTNSYDDLQNSVFLATIIKLEQMQNNLYIASDGFGDDDIVNILNNIRDNLDSLNCSMKNEFFVVKQTDCPSGSVISTTISTTTNTSSIVHCYIIQNLTTNAQVAYTGPNCSNTYINSAITFIKQIDSLLSQRIEKIKNLQKSYSTTWSYLKNEITTTSQSLNETYNILNNELGAASSNATNCSSVRYDLINFSDYFMDKTEYRAKIILIFSAFAGVFGFVLFYTFLIVLNTFKDNFSYEDYSEGYGFNYNNKKRNKIQYNYGKGDDDDDEENNFKSKSPLKNEKTPPRNQKVEMSYMSKKKKNDEENSDDDDDDE